MSMPKSFRAAVTLDLIDLPLIILPALGLMLVQRTFELPPRTGIRRLAGLIGALLAARRMLIGWPKIPPKTKARSTSIEIFALLAGIFGALFLLVNGVNFYRHGDASSAMYAVGGLIGLCAGVALYRINRRPAPSPDDTPSG